MLLSHPNYNTDSQLGICYRWCECVCARALFLCVPLH